MLKHVKPYYQCVRSTIHLKTKISSLNALEIKGPPERSSSGLLHPVSSDQECYHKGGKCKISLVLQLPVSSPQASTKVEASHRPQQAQLLFCSRKVQN